MKSLIVGGFVFLSLLLIVSACIQSAELEPFSSQQVQAIMEYFDISELEMRDIPVRADDTRGAMQTLMVDIPCVKIGETQYGEFWLDAINPLAGYYTRIMHVMSQFDEEVYGFVTETFGAVSDLDNNGKIMVVLLEFKAVSTEASQTGGFQDSLQFYNIEGEHTIRGEMVVIRMNQKQLSAAALAHEIVHLIFHNQKFLANGRMDPTKLFTAEGFSAQIGDIHNWMNEGMAVMAQYLYEGGLDNSYAFLLYENILQNNQDVYFFGKYMPVADGYPIFVWNSNSYSYAWASFFMSYLYLHCNSETFLMDVMKHPEPTTVAVVDICRNYGFIEETEGMREIMRDFLLALYFKDLDSRYGFKGIIRRSGNLEEGTDTYPFFSSLRDKAYLYPGGFLCFPVNPDTPFEASPATNIAYLGVNSETQEIDMDETDGYAGDILFAYHYGVTISGFSTYVQIPSEADIRDVN